MSGLAAALRLRRVAAALREGRPVDPADAAPLSIGLAEWLAGRAATLEAALQLVAGRGETSAREALRLHDRDRALCALAARHEHLDLAGRAWFVRDELEAFAWNWPRYAGLPACPDNLVGRREELLFEVLRCSGGEVLGERRIADILRGSEKASSFPSAESPCDSSREIDPARRR